MAQVIAAPNHTTTANAPGGPMFDFIAKLDGWAQWLLAVGAAVAMVAGFVRYIRPMWRNAKSDARAIRDTLVGREATRDTITGEEIRPAIPGIGVRMANIETTVDLLVKQDKRLDSVEARLDRIESGAFLERLASKAESIQLLSTIESAVKADPRDDDHSPAA